MPGRDGARFHNVRRLGFKLQAVAADGTIMELHRFVPGETLGDHLAPDPTTKAGRGVCSASSCEERARFLTLRSGRNWALCVSHAELLANDTDTWKPGLPIQTFE
jgi:hypothetical protein